MWMREFLEMNCTEGDTIIICNCTLDVENIFKGTVNEALNSEDFDITHALENNISSWDIEDGKLCLNYDENI